MPPKRRVALVASAKSSHTDSPSSRAARLLNRQKPGDTEELIDKAEDDESREIVESAADPTTAATASPTAASPPLDTPAVADETIEPYYDDPEVEMTADTESAAVIEDTDAAALAAREEDLNYDEYDLAEECDMIVTCKTCDAVFKTLEKFVQHKQSKCKGRRSMSNPDTTEKKKKKTDDVPWFFEPFAEDNSDSVRRSERKRKPKIPGGGDTDEPIRKRTVPRSQIASKSLGAKAVKALPESQILSIDTPDRLKAATLPDQVERIWTENDRVGDDPDSRLVVVKKSAASADKQTESDTDSEVDLDNIISMTIQPTVAEEDEELPVEVTPLLDTTDDTPKKSRIIRSGVSKQQQQTTPHIPYRVIRVEESDREVSQLPALGLTKEALSKVKVMNLMKPISGGEKERQTERGRTVSDHPSGDILGTLITVHASTKDSVAVRLMLRRVIKTAAEVAQQVADEINSKLGADGDMSLTAEGDLTSNDLLDEDGAIEDVEGDDAVGSSSFSRQPADVSVPVSNVKSVTAGVSGVTGDTGDTSVSMEEQVEEDEDGDHNFECDPDLYEWLRDDEKYVLMPKSRNRMSRNVMKERDDCDLLTRRCLRCNTLYSCVKTLINHMSYQHSDKKSFFPCIYCRNVYSQLKNVSRHVEKSHGKTKEFVIKLRSFMRCQAFIRQIKGLDFNSEKLTEENDPFLQNIRTREVPSNPTRYGMMEDSLMLAKYGRKTQVIGRPPGRPAKTIKSGVTMTCTICKQAQYSTKDMLAHLKNTHDYTVKQLAKLRPKLVAKMNDVTVSERMKSAEKLKAEEAAARPRLIARPATGPSISTTTTPGGNTVRATPTVSSTHHIVDQYGRMVNPPKTPVRQIVLTSPGQSGNVAVKGGLTEYVYMKARSEPVVKLSRCGHCHKLFATDRDLQKHLVSCSMGTSHSQILTTSKPQTAQVGTTHYQLAPSAVGGAQIQLIETGGRLVDAGGREVIVKSADSGGVKIVNEEPESYIIEHFSQPKSWKAQTVTTSSSGLETLATISTNEAKKSSTELTLPTMSVSTSGPAHTLQLNQSEEELAEEGGDNMETLTITMDQLEQLKAGGNNIVYVVKTPNGVQRIEDPDGMEIVEISQL